MFRLIICYNDNIKKFKFEYSWLNVINEQIQINPIFNDLEEYTLNNNKVLRVIIVVMLVAVVLALILTSVVPLVN